MARAHSLSRLLPGARSRRPTGPARQPTAAHSPQPTVGAGAGLLSGHPERVSAQCYRPLIFPTITPPTILFQQNILVLVKP